MSKTKVDSTGIDLTDNFAFTGTVSGTPGITVADQWYMGTAFQGSNADITSNWTSTMPYTGYGVIGSAVTESSGIFTFPSTGLYQVVCNPSVIAVSDNQALVLTNVSSNSGGAFDDAETKQTTDETSGKTKLKNLGLTDDEIKALTGK